MTQVFGSEADFRRYFLWFDLCAVLFAPRRAVQVVAVVFATFFAAFQWHRVRGGQS